LSHAKAPALPFEHHPLRSRSHADLQLIALFDIFYNAKQDQIESELN
jgi:hypothetical protein